MMGRGGSFTLGGFIMAKENMGFLLNERSLKVLLETEMKKEKEKEKCAQHNK